MSSAPSSSAPAASELIHVVTYLQNGKELRCEKRGLHYEIWDPSMPQNHVAPYASREELHEGVYKILRDTPVAVSVSERLRQSMQVKSKEWQGMHCVADFDKRWPSSYACYHMTTEDRRAQYFRSTSSL